MLLTFEGIDGSGKSTQARRLAERLEAEGHGVLFVREPGGTPLSEGVRALLLDPALDVAPLAELLLFSAARAQLVARRLRPALVQGQIVVCDRFYDSTTAYQGGGRAVAPVEWLRTFNQRVTGGLVPDRTYLLGLDPHAARARMEAAGAAPDRMEAAGLAFQQRVADAYRRLAEAEPGRFLVLDAHADVGTLHRRIWADVQRLLAARNPA